MANKKLIFSVCFTGKGLHNGFRGMDWYDLRADIFNDQVIASLKNQSDKDFLVWLQFRPQEKGNPITKRIEQALKKSGLEYVMTFDGIMMHDDRGVEHNIDLVKRFNKSVKKLKIKEDYIYEANLDSDDLIDMDYVKIIKSKPFKKHGALYCKKGYAYRIGGQLADWHNPISNQNYTIMYPRDIFLDGKKHFKYQNGLHTHEQIPELFDAEELPDNMYCAIIHGTNISTVWEHPFKGEEYFYDNIIKQILTNFGIC